MLICYLAVDLFVYILNLYVIVSYSIWLWLYVIKQQLFCEVDYVIYTAAQSIVY